MTVNDCEQCGHAYTPSYGRWWHTNGGAKWLCHDCGQAKADKAAAPRCVTCGVTLDPAVDPAVTTLGPRCRKHF